MGPDRVGESRQRDGVVAAGRYVKHMIPLAFSGRQAGADVLRSAAPEGQLSRTGAEIAGLQGLSQPPKQTMESKQTFLHSECRILGASKSRWLGAN